MPVRRLVLEIWITTPARSEGGETWMKCFPCHKEFSIHQKPQKLWPAVVNRRGAYPVVGPHISQTTRQKLTWLGIAVIPQPALFSRPFLHSTTLFPGSKCVPVPEGVQQSGAGQKCSPAVGQFLLSHFLSEWNNCVVISLPTLCDGDDAYCY